MNFFDFIYFFYKRVSILLSVRLVSSILRKKKFFSVLLIKDSNLILNIQITGDFRAIQQFR